MAKFFLKTFGCTYNQADSEAAAMLLSAAGHSPAGLSEADAVVVNTCSVKTPTQNKVIAFLKRVKKPLLVTGCLAQTMPWMIEKHIPAASVLGTFAQADVAAALEETLAGRKVKWLEKKNQPPLSATVDGVVARVRIASGCLSACSFCQTRLARGGLRSRSITEVRRVVEKAVEEGAKEIRLTAQDTGCYGMDNCSSLPELLEAISSIRGNFMVRVGMMNPQHTTNCFEELLAAFGDEKIFKFLHVPVQSGSDSVLESMGRGHSVKDFEKIVSGFRKKFPESTVATDVITGYPTEAHGDFLKTLDLLKRVQPDVVNVSRFCPRPGTRAAELPPLPDRVVKERSRKCFVLCRRIAFEKNKSLVGKHFEVLATEKTRNAAAGRTRGYKTVLVREAVLGEWIDARITSAGPCHLLGEKIG